MDPETPAQLLAPADNTASFLQLPLQGVVRPISRNPARSLHVSFRLPSSSSFCLQVALVYPNNDPAAFMTAFYGCLLAEVVPVPIEVPLSRKVSEMNPAATSLTF